MYLCYRNVLLALNFVDNEIFCFVYRGADMKGRPRLPMLDAVHRCAIKFTM